LLEINHNGNGPAVGFSKRYPTQHPGRILVPRVSEAEKLSRCKEGEPVPQGGKQLTHSSCPY